VIPYYEMKAIEMVSNGGGNCSLKKQLNFAFYALKKVKDPVLLIEKDIITFYNASFINLCCAITNKDKKDIIIEEGMKVNHILIFSDKESKHGEIFMNTLKLCINEERTIDKVFKFERRRNSMDALGNSLTYGSGRFLNLKVSFSPFDVKSNYICCTFEVLDDYTQDNNNITTLESKLITLELYEVIISHYNIYFMFYFRYYVLKDDK
jgi:hypothetical protein